MTRIDQDAPEFESVSKSSADRFQVSKQATGFDSTHSNSLLCQGKRQF